VRKEWKTKRTDLPNIAKGGSPQRRAPFPVVEGGTIQLA
jgi:hypothetical protein